VATRQLEFTETRVPVAGIHPNPIRVYAHMDSGQAELLGLAGAANQINLEPRPGADIDDLKRAVLAIDGVATVERVAVAGEASPRP
jgi:putative ABC transport system permease protein